MKKVLLIIIDALSSKVLIPALNNGDLPNLSALAQVDPYHESSVAIFPSLTPAATASLVTGQYPEQHGIMGYHWYEKEQHEVVYYGEDFWVVVQRGFAEFFNDLLFKLNHQRLQAPTLFQQIERTGLRTACLNYPIFRGEKTHQVNAPLMLKLLPGVPFSESVWGPSIMYFGDLVAAEIEETGEPLDRTGGLLHRFGFDDENTGNLLIQLAQKKALPHFTLAYFPDNDFESHEVGSQAALPTLKKIDERLGDLIQIYGDMEKMLNELCLVITGDHAQSDILGKEAQAAIQLDEILGDFEIPESGRPWREDDDLIICPDMRSAQIYFQYPNSNQIKQVVNLLLADERIDQVMWPAQVLGDREQGYYVATIDRGQLHFQPGQSGSQSGVDKYGQWWSWSGSLAAVGGEVLENNRLTFPEYPNAFERITGTLKANNGGHLWITGRLGYEFRVAKTEVHFNGGSHGSLHALDSLSPLIIVGAPEETPLPAHPRAVDITPLCMNILGLLSTEA